MKAILFQIIHQLVTRWPKSVIALALVSAALCGGYGVFNMDLIADQNRLISQDLDYHARYMDFIDRFGDLEFLYILIEGPTKESMIAFADDLNRRLQRSPDIEKVIYRFDTSWTQDYALHYASLKQLQRLKRNLKAEKPCLAQLASTPSVDHLLQRISTSLSQASAGEAASATQTQALSSLITALKGEYQSPFSEFSLLKKNHGQASQSTEYFWSNNQSALLMLVMPQKDYSTLSVIEKPLKRVRRDIRLTEMEHKGVKAGLTGRPALQADEMATSRQDMQRASLVALIGVSVLFMLFFREIVRPLLAITALMLAMGWTYGTVALTLGHLNLLSSVFALIIIGLGIDFGIHFLHRYQEEFKKLGSPNFAVAGSLRYTGSGILTGAITSSVAFLSALSTEFKGIAELGYVAGIGILFCLLAMLVVLAAMLFAYDKHHRDPCRLPAPLHFNSLCVVSRRPGMLLLILIAATIAFIPQAMQVRFDDNLLNLQAEGLESVKYEHKLLQSSEYSTWYSAFLMPDYPSVLRTVNQLNQNPQVAAVSSIADVLPKQFPQKHPLLETIHQTLNRYDFTAQEYQPDPAAYQTLREHLKAFLQQLQVMPSNNTAAAIDAKNTASPEEKLLFQLQELLALLSADENTMQTRLKRANFDLIGEPKTVLQQLSDSSQPEPIKISQLPQVFQDLYVGNDGALLVMAYPKNNIWEHEAMKRFVTEMREIDPNVTGTPVQVYETSRLMREAFKTIGLLSLIAVTVLVYLDFLSLRATFFVVGPLLLGVLWLLEIMGVMNVHLNLANFFAIPVLIGIGVDNAIHIYHRYEETGDIEKAVTTTGTTLTLTSLTTGLGFGSLMLAAHKGLSSLGVLMLLGTAACWFSCVLVMPLFIRLFAPKKHKSGKYRLAD